MFSALKHSKVVTMLRTGIVISTLIILSSGATLPPNFQKCNRHEPDLKQCIFKAAQNGISQLTRAYPEVNIPNVNPFEVQEATIPGSGAVAVTQKFKQCKLTGFHGLQLDHFEFDFGKKALVANGTFPEIVLKCQYSLDGRVLLLPIKGTGPATVILKSLKMDAVLDYEEVKRRRKTYIKFSKMDLEIDPELVFYNFENLFDGDKRLGDNINLVLNDNWKDVFEEVKPGYVEFVKKVVLTLLENFFSKVSLEEALD